MLLGWRRRGWHRKSSRRRNRLRTSGERRRKIERCGLFVGVARHVDINVFKGFKGKNQNLFFCCK